MFYMDEWEYNLWLELHKGEILASKHAGSVDEEQNSEVSASPESE